MVSVEGIEICELFLLARAIITVFSRGILDSTFRCLEAGTICSVGVRYVRTSIFVEVRYSTSSTLLRDILKNDDVVTTKKDDTR